MTGGYRHLSVKKTVFRIRVFFFPDPDQIFFLSPDPDGPKIRIRSAKIRIRKKNRPKTGVKVEKDFIGYRYIISSNLNTLLFGQFPPNSKTYQNYHLDPISLLMDGSGSGLLKPGSGPELICRI